MLHKRILVLVVLIAPLLSSAQLDSVDCVSLNELIRIVSTKVIRESDGERIDSTTTLQNFVLKYHLFNLDEIADLETVQYTKSKKVAHTERFFPSQNQQTQLGLFDEIVGKLHHFCLPEWEKTSLKDLSGEKDYLYKVLFTNFEDETTIALSLSENTEKKFIIQLQIFN